MNRLKSSQKKTRIGRICSNSFCRCIHFGIDRYFSAQGECEFLINLKALEPVYPGTVNQWTNENVLFVAYVLRMRDSSLRSLAYSD